MERLNYRCGQASASSQRRGTPLMQLHLLPLLSTLERSHPCPHWRVPSCFTCHRLVSSQPESAYPERGIWPLTSLTCPNSPCLSALLRRAPLPTPSLPLRCLVFTPGQRKKDATLPDKPIPLPSMIHDTRASAEIHCNDIHYPRGPSHLYKLSNMGVPSSYWYYWFTRNPQFNWYDWTAYRQTPSQSSSI